jgi:hypothetical protein
VRDALEKLRNSRVREHARGQASKLARSRIPESSCPPGHHGLLLPEETGSPEVANRVLGDSRGKGTYLIF